MQELGIGLELFPRVFDAAKEPRHRMVIDQRYDFCHALGKSRQGRGAPR
jgi:hypothetical protein